MNFPITDSHLHLWDDKNLHYSWLKTLPMLDRSFLLSDLMEATKSLHLESIVFVQSGCDETESLDEVNWVTDLAKRDARIQAIIAYAALETGDNVQDYLTLLKKNKLVKGVRRSLNNEKDDFCLQEKFIQGVKLLTEFNFSFDICIRAQQLPSVIRMVEQCPQVKFILEHLGNPAIAEKELTRWQAQITELAVFPNVWCKVSRFLHEDRPAWSSEDLKPYLYHAIKEFSYDRVLFGSDWPVVNLAASYAHWMHTLYDLLSHNNASPEELEKVFHSNARRCYEMQTEVVEI